LVDVFLDTEPGVVTASQKSNKSQFYPLSAIVLMINC
jgi:hypothetical protein